MYCTSVKLMSVVLFYSAESDIIDDLLVLDQSLATYCAAFSKSKTYSHRVLYCKTRSYSHCILGERSLVRELRWWCIFSRGVTAARKSVGKMVAVIGVASVGACTRLTCWVRLRPRERRHSPTSRWVLPLKFTRMRVPVPSWELPELSVSPNYCNEKLSKSWFLLFICTW